MASTKSRGAKRISELTLIDGRSLIVTEADDSKLKWDEIPVGTIRMTSDGTPYCKKNGSDKWEPFIAGMSEDDLVAFLGSDIISSAEVRALFEGIDFDPVPVPDDPSDPTPIDPTPTDPEVDDPDWDEYEEIDHIFGIDSSDGWDEREEVDSMFDDIPDPDPEMIPSEESGMDSMFGG